MTTTRGMIAITTVSVFLAGGTGILVALRRPIGAAAPDTAPVAVVREQAFFPRVVSTGNVRRLPGARIEVGARISGVVVSLAVTQGTRVDRNAIIARLDDREARTRLAQAEATVTELEASVAQQSEDANRVETIANSGGATPQEVLAARTALATARARLAGARANRELARLQLVYTVIRAPAAGVVASATTHEGETVAASLAAPTFVSLIDPARIECVALVDDSDIGRVLEATMTIPLRRGIEPAVIGRLLSGFPFTPEVAQDINGEGSGMIAPSCSTLPRPPIPGSPAECGGSWPRGRPPRANAWSRSSGASPSGMAVRASGSPAWTSS